MSSSAPAPSILAAKRKLSLALFDRVVGHILDGSNTHPAIEREGISKRQVSAASRGESPTLAANSAFERALSASAKLAPIDVPDLST